MEDITDTDYKHVEFVTQFIGLKKLTRNTGKIMKQTKNHHNSCTGMSTTCLNGKC